MAEPPLTPIYLQLFLYSEQFSMDSHIDSLIELCRVAKQLRIYPLITLNGEVSPHLNLVMSKLNKLGKTVSMVDVS